MRLPKPGQNQYEKERGGKRENLPVFSTHERAEYLSFPPVSLKKKRYFFFSGLFSLRILWAFAVLASNVGGREEEEEEKEEDGVHLLNHTDP